MDTPEPRRGELGFSDQLAIERTILAVDRSLLAWVRTSLSLISFGFTAYKILQYMVERDTTGFLRTQTPRNVGLVLLLTGTVPLLLAMFGYRQTQKRLYGLLGALPPWLIRNPNFVAASVIFLLGCALTVVVILHIRLL